MSVARHGQPDAGDRLWELIPRWTRTKDRLADGVLEGLVRALGVGVDGVRADVLRLQGDMFVDTCAPELVPLIGDLVGETLDPRVPVDRQRYQVKQALHWRRRKGTPAQLVALAWVLSGFRARVIEPVVGDARGESGKLARILGTSPATLGTQVQRIVGDVPADTIRLLLDVVWPVRRRELLLTHVGPSGADVHAAHPGADIGLRRSDGTPILRSDDPSTLVGPGLDIEVVGIGGDLAQLGRLEPRFYDLGGASPPNIPHYTLAVDPERGRVAGPTAIVGAVQRMRRYRLGFWEALRAEPVVGTPHHLGDGTYTFASNGADRWLTDEQAYPLDTFGPDLCSGPLRVPADKRVILTPLRGGCQVVGGDAPYVVLEAGAKPADMKAALADGLPLDVPGLRRFFAIEDSWGWDAFAAVRLVHRFSREAPPDDTVEVDLRHGRFRVGPTHAGAALRVHYFRPYDVDEVRSRVREALLNAVPVGRRAIVTFRDTAVPGYTARKMS